MSHTNVTASSVNMNGDLFGYTRVHPQITNGKSGPRRRYLYTCNTCGKEVMGAGFALDRHYQSALCMRRAAGEF